MISLELAQALRDAGVKWKPQLGDCYRMSNGNYTIFSEDRDFEFFRSTINTRNHGIYQNLLMPRLEQILEEIERLGWEWILILDSNPDKYNYCIGVNRHSDPYPIWDEFGLSPVDAAAKGLLWILKEGQE